jgi:hypothetical protein
MKNAVFWDSTSCDFVRANVSAERIFSIIRETRKDDVGVTLFLRSVRRLQVTINVVPNSLILVTLRMEALHSDEVSVLTRSIMA